MSEKEKRILILTDTDPIGLCDKAHAFQYDFCPFTGNGKKTCREVCGLGLPRTEAIKRMAKAMEAPYFNDVHASEPDMLEALAEAALEALITEVK